MAKTKGRKHWVSIIAPKLFNEQVIGDTVVIDAKDAIGRRIHIDISKLGVEGKHKGRVEFEIIGTAGDNLQTEIIGYNLKNPTVKRLVRRNRRRIDDSFIVITKDDKHIRIKPLLITRFLTSKAVVTSIRKLARGIIATIAKRMTHEQFATEIITYKLQRKLFDKVKKTFPLASCEIRIMHVLKHTKAKSGVIKIRVTEKPKEEAIIAE
jgi:ribosomal protein S3AE